MFRILTLFILFCGYGSSHAENYTDKRFGHAEAFTPFVDTIVAEGQEFIAKIHKGEDLPVPKLAALMNEPVMQSLKYAPLRETVAVMSGGFRWASSLVCGESEAVLSRRKYLAQLITVMWGIFGHSVDKNQGFARGSYKIIDPEHKLYNFLVGYVKLVMGVDDPHSYSMVTTACNFAYRRAPRLGESSHYLDETENDQQFGIDMRRENYETPLKILPASKSHLLFAKIKVPGSDVNLTFVKFEEVGMGSIGESLDHGLNFGASHTNVKTVDRREKDMPAGIATAFRNLLMRIDPTDALLAAEAKPLKTVYGMYTYIREKYAGRDESELYLLIFRRAVADAGFEAAYADIRNGNEVILELNPAVVRAWGEF